MTTGAESPGAPPQRMRDYRVEADLRSSPDLHKLAQVFIGMAQARARQEHRENARQESRPERTGGQGVES